MEDLGLKDIKIKRKKQTKNIVEKRSNYEKTECTVLDIIFHIKDKIKEYDNDIERLNIPLRHLPEIQKKTLEEVLHAIEKKV